MAGTLTTAAPAAAGVNGMTLSQIVANTAGAVVGVTAIGYAQGQKVQVTGDPHGLPLPSPEPGWDQGKNMFAKSCSDYAYVSSWHALDDPASPAADVSIRINSKMQICRKELRALSTNIIGVTAHYSNGDDTSRWDYVKDWDGETCSSPAELTLTIPTKSGSGTLLRVEAFDQGRVSCGYGDVYQCFTWYPKWSSLRPPTYSPGDGTVTRWGVCVGADGSSIRIESSVSLDLQQAGAQDLPDLQCPAGRTLDEYGVDWTPSAPGSTTTPVVPRTPNAPWVRDIPRGYPECSGGGCVLRLWHIVQSQRQTCGDLAVDCQFWYVSSTRTQDYACTWGPYDVDLHYCSALRDPGRVLPNDQPGFPPLELDSAVVAQLKAQLVGRYANSQSTACAVLGESLRTIRADALVTVPDVVDICTSSDIGAALQWITDLGSQGLAVATLSNALLADPTPSNFRPDCDEIDAVGNCLEWTSDYGDDTQVTPEPEPAAAGAGGQVPPPASCLDEAQRSEVLGRLPDQGHHMATWYGAYGSEFQEVLDEYQLNLNVKSTTWNVFTIPHQGRHPKEYHDWVMENFRNAAKSAGVGNTQEFLRLFNRWVVDKVTADPTIVRVDYWKCYR